MAIVNGYCTDDELQEWNKATESADAGVRERVINAASRAVDQWCDRHFYQDVAASRDLAPDNAYEFDLGPFNDLHSISALVTDTAGDGTFETTWAAADYELLRPTPKRVPEQEPYTSIRSTGTKPFPYLSTKVGETGRAHRVRITGTWGWSAIPEAVTLACLMLGARFFKRKESPDGVAGWGAFGDIRISRTDADVVALLKEYRLSPRVGMVRVR